MIEFAGHIEKRGGTPLEAVEYKHIYLDRLSEKIKDRIAGLESGSISPDEMIVPGGPRDTVFDPRRLGRRDGAYDDGVVARAQQWRE